MAGSPGVKINPKRARLMTDFNKCVKCQTGGGSSLEVGQPNSIERFVAAAKAQQDEVYYRIESDIVGEELNSGTVKWHKSCYASYTNICNIRC